MGVKIRNIIKKILPTLKNLEENPKAKIIRISKAKSNIPSFGSLPVSEEYDIEIEVPVIYNEQPEIVTSGNNITTQKRMYVYIHEDDLPEDFGKIRMEDRIILDGVRYKPVGIRYMFGLLEIRAEKV
jgi:hypothetical protein